MPGTNIGCPNRSYSGIFGLLGFFFGIVDVVFDVKLLAEVSMLEPVQPLLIFCTASSIGATSLVSLIIGWLILREVRKDRAADKWVSDRGAQMQLVIVRSISEHRPLAGLLVSAVVLASVSRIESIGILRTQNIQVNAKP